jgi:hypothetical protein
MGTGLTQLNNNLFFIFQHITQIFQKRNYGNATGRCGVY